MFFGSNYSFTVRASAVASNTYVMGAALTALLSNQAVFNVSVTLGSATNVKMKVLFSRDVLPPTTTVSWYTEAIADNASAVTSSTEWQSNVFERIYVFTANGKYSIAVPCKSKWITAAVLATGTTTGSLVAVDANMGMV